MGDMSWLSHLVTTGAREELEDFLKDKGFRKPKFAAEQFLKAQEEIERDGMKRQLKGKNNYTAFAEYLDKHEILDNPDLVVDEYAFESAMFFFDKNKLWSICDKGVDSATILKLTKRINGGTNGLDHREDLTLKYYNLVK